MKKITVEQRIYRELLDIVKSSKTDLKLEELKRTARTYNNLLAHEELKRKGTREYSEAILERTEESFLRRTMGLGYKDANIVHTSDSFMCNILLNEKGCLVYKLRKQEAKALNTDLKSTHTEQAGSNLLTENERQTTSTLPKTKGTENKGEIIFYLHIY